MAKPYSKQIQPATWTITGLQIGAVLFAGGLTLLYLNPFWHFDGSGLLDWRASWWNAGCEMMLAGGLSIAVLAVIAAVAVLVSRFTGRSLWPYAVAVLIVAGMVAWAGMRGFTRDLQAHFEWNTAEGFTVFRLQSSDGSGNPPGPVENSALQSLVAMQIQPMLRGYFKLNDWQKMNGNLEVRVAEVIPAAWPIALGSGGETLEDPDETPLMRAAAQGDLQAVRQILMDGTSANLNALDQGGQSALILACQNSKANPELVKALIAAGANVNIRSRTGYTALTWALAKNNNEVSKVLRRAGGKP